MLAFLLLLELNSDEQLKSGEWVKRANISSIFWAFKVNAGYGPKRQAFFDSGDNSGF